MITKYFSETWFYGAAHSRYFYGCDIPDVQIDLEAPHSSQLSDINYRPIRVQGIVIPVPVGNRGSTPMASTGYHGYDLDRGHIFALNLGGPDVSENIVPQWAKWQRTGSWRQMERKIRAFAIETMETSRQGHFEKPERFVYLHITIHYTGSLSFSRWSTPEAYSFQIYTCDINANNATLVEEFNITGYPSV